jgi:hypothetical protein
MLDFSKLGKNFVIRGFQLKTGRDYNLILLVSLPYVTCGILECDFWPSRPDSVLLFRYRIVSLDGV